MSEATQERHVIGWTCPHDTDGEVAPMSALTDPCGDDVFVWSDGSTSPVQSPAVQAWDAELEEARAADQPPAPRESSAS